MTPPAMKAIRHPYCTASSGLITRPTTSAMPVAIATPAVTHA